MSFFRVPRETRELCYTIIDRTTWRRILRELEDGVQKKRVETRFCVPREARTLDPLIKSQLLYQLS